MELHEKQSDAKNRAIARLIEDVRTSRAAGKPVDDEMAVAAHPDLMPELAEALVKLRRIEAAGRAAAAGTAAGDETVTTSDAPAALLAELQRPAIQIPGYTMVKELSRGGQGVVYLAIQLSTGRKIAVKVMREGPLADERSMARFKLEVQVLASLNHPNIVNIIDTGETSDGSRYLVMNYISGGSLDDYMKRRHRKDASDPSKLLRTFLKICDAVNAAHLRGIVHRDIKPSNIRVDDRGDPFVLDFGLARSGLDRLSHGDQPVSITGEFLGSLPWSSPEQAEGNPSKIDTRTDVYSLGVILYQMLTGGRFPYEVVGNIRDVLNNILTAAPLPPSKVIADLAKAKTEQDKDWAARHRPAAVNEGIERVVLRALSKQRERRYQTAGEMGKDVANYLRGLPTGGTARVPEKIPRAGETKGPAGFSARWKMVIVGAAACVLIAGIAIMLPALAKSSKPTFPATDGAGQTVLPANGPGSVRGSAEGWTQLFNGKNFAGWDSGAMFVPTTGRGPDSQLLADWKVTEGVIVSTGGIKRGNGTLTTSKNDYGDFEIRVTTKLGRPGDATLNNDGSGSINFVGANDATTGFQVWIAGTGPDSKVTTGEIYTGGISAARGRGSSLNLFGGGLPKGTAKKVAIGADEWFTLDITTKAGQVTVLVNGEKVSEYSDKGLWGLPVSIQLMHVHHSTQQFKEIEIREFGKVMQPALAAPSASPVANLAQTATRPRTPASVAPNTSATPVIPTTAVTHGAHHYLFVRMDTGWNDAAQRCVQLGGRLATLRTDNADFLQGLKSEDLTAWVGASANADGRWTWSDGSDVDASLMDTTSGLPGYNWLFMMRNGKLGPRPESGRVVGATVPTVQGFICEWVQ